MIYEMACADAFGIAFEFVAKPKDHGLLNDLTVGYQMHPKYGPSGELKPSQFTDDTLRSIANANVVLILDPFNPAHYVGALQSLVEEDRRKGWSKRFQQYLEANLNSTPWDFITGIPKRAESNGSIMGAAPLGYLSDPVSVRMAATLQAITTHSAMTAPYAQAIALAAHYFIYDLGTVDELAYYLTEEVEGGKEVFSDLRIADHLPEKPVDMSARATCFAVIQLVSRQRSLSSLIQRAVQIGGDTDSVAALAVAIGSCSKEIENDLPLVLLDGLEEGNTAMHLKLRDLDTRLEMLALR